MMRMQIAAVLVGLVLLIGGTYFAWQFTVEPAAIAPESGTGEEFSSDRGAVGQSSGFPAESQGREDYIVFTHKSASTTVVLLQPKQPTAEQPSIGTDAQGEGQAVSSIFAAQSQSGGLEDAKSAIIVSSYSLQLWGDEHTAGEALMKRSAGGAWELISMGGGAWSVNGLVDFGVPRAVAERLVADKPWAQAQ